MKDLQYLHSEITGKILKVFFQVFNNLGYGFEKSVYINSLHIELQKEGLKSERNKVVEIFYQAIDVGNFISDIVVEGKVLLKISMKEEISVIDEQVLHNNLKVCEYQVGLLLNFGLQPQHKRKVYLNEGKTNLS